MNGIVHVQTPAAAVLYNLGERVVIWRRLLLLIANQSGSKSHLIGFHFRLGGNKHSTCEPPWMNMRLTCTVPQKRL